MIFVFGSNEKGVHGAGAALNAALNHGAVLHQGFGPQGNSFAIPTCSRPTNRIYELETANISLDKLTFYVDCFLIYAKENPRLQFKVTKIGCGLAGWKDEVVAPLFSLSPFNCYFDRGWEKYLVRKKYWGAHPI